MPRLEMWHKVCLLIGLAFAVFFFCEKRWEESQAIAEVQFTAFSNKEMYLKMKLDDICRKYGYNRYPCPTGKFQEQDKIDYQQYEEWLKAQRGQIRGIFKHG